MSPAFPIESEVSVRRMDGPPESGFDCGRPEQNLYLYEHAWDDQIAGVSVTYLYHVKGILAAFITVCADGLPLGPRERDSSIRYGEVGALKLAQLGVTLRFQGMGLGRMIMGDVLTIARDEAERIGCRFVTLEAKPDVVGFYERFGFVRNKLRQERRIQNALARGRDPSAIPVSMRYDIRKVIN